MPAKRRPKTLKQKPAFQRLRKLIDQPGRKDLLWYHHVGNCVEALFPAEDRGYGKSQIDTLTEALGQPKPFADRLWNARRFIAAYDRNEIKALCQPREGSQFRLTRSHMTQLLSLDDSARSRFQRKCIKGEWSTRELIHRIKDYRGRKGKGGRQYQRPATLEDGLRQLTAESEDWRRRFDQVWFPPDHPAIDWDDAAASTVEVAERCRKAVEVLESIQLRIKQRLPELRSHTRPKKKPRRRRKGK